jgi:hypothetical protein
VNRLEDSFLLWGSVVSSKLLAKTAIILFTNKVDLLERKLDAGVPIRKWLTSYGDRPNAAVDVTKCEDMWSVRQGSMLIMCVADLLNKFKDAHGKLSPEKRPFYGHPTSVVNTIATQKTLASSTCFFSRPPESDLIIHVQSATASS